MLRVMALVLFLATASSCFADTPGFVASVQLNAPPTVSRATVDGKRFVTLLQAKDKKPAGIQVVDTSDAHHPKLMGFLPTPYGAFSLSDDGNTALLVSATEKEMFNKETNHEIIAIDLTDPNKPKELWRRKLSARKVVLSAGANAYAYSKASASKQGLWETIINFVKGERAPVTIEETQYSQADMYLSPHANFLVYISFAQQLYVWDLKATTPKLYEQEYSGYQRYECVAAVLDDGYVVVKDTRLPRFGIYGPSLGMPRVSTLAHNGSRGDYRQYCSPLNPSASDGRFVYPDGHRRLQQINFHNPKTPNMGRIWQAPPEMYPVAVGQNLLFAVTGGSEPDLKIYRLDIKGKEEVDWIALAKAHASIMEKYNADMKERKPIPYFEATTRFEQAGILNALDAPVENIPPEKAAAILNDYGFLAAKKRISADLIEHILRRSITLAHHRSLAYLNLADFLRGQLPFYSANGRDVNAVRKEIEGHYRTYVSLGGKPTPSINAFLKGDQTITSANNACAGIAAYTNAGRLSEFVSGVGVNIPFKGRRIDLAFTTEGTAHVPTFYGFDSNTDFPLKDDDLPSLPSESENAWGGDELGLLTYRNESHILFYRDLQHPTSSISLATGDQCKFSISTNEKIGSSATEPSLCANLQKDKGPDPYDFDTKSLMDEDSVSQQWGESEITGTRVLDFANDGKPVNVAELQMASGAGAGCSETFYETVSPDATKFVSGPKRDLLMQIQAAMPTNRYPILPCGNKPSFFSYKHRVYFETKPANWPPIDKWNQYHRVTTVIDGKVRDVCDFKFETTVVGQ